MINQTSGFSHNLGLYWRYEQAVRRNESHVSSVIGAAGPLYAIRSSLFRPLPKDTVLDDVAVPFAIVRQGYRVDYEPGAIALERATDSSSSEFIRKRRTLAGNYQLIFRHWRLLIPLSSPIAWQFWSHKVFRLLVPYAMACLLISSFGLSRESRTVALSLQSLFYLAALSASLAPRKSSRSWLTFPYTFCLLNLAAVSGSFDYFSRRLNVCWEKVK